MAHFECLYLTNLIQIISLFGENWVCQVWKTLHYGIYNSNNNFKIHYLNSIVSFNSVYLTDLGLLPTWSTSST